MSKARPNYEQLERRVRELEKEVEKRKKTEQRFLKSEAKLRAIFNASSLAIALIDRNGIVIDTNEEHASRLRMTRDQLMGKCVWDFLPQSVRTRRKKQVEKVFSTGEPYSGEDEMQGVWNSYHIHPAIWNKQGGLEAVVVEALDITRLKQVERKLAVNEKYLRLMLNSIHEDIVVIDRNYIVRDLNNTMMTTTGWVRNQIIGRPCYEISHGYSQPCDIMDDNCKCGLKEVLETGRPSDCHHRHLCADGSYKDVDILISPLIDERGKITGVIEAIRDVSYLFKIQQDLRENDKKYRPFYENSPEAILIFDPETMKYTDANHTALDLYGYTKDEFLQLTPYDLSAEKDKTLAYLEDLNKKGRTEPVEMLQKRKDGSLWPAEIYSSYFEMKGKNLFITQIRDISERKQLEEERSKATKLESIGVLAGGIAHDFNNILAVILGNVAIAKMVSEMESNDEIKKALSLAEKACNRARELTRQLLTFSKGGAPVKRVTALAELIRESTRFSLRGSNVRCRHYLAKDLWHCNVDQGQISQVINNLVINADQAMPKGGTITVRAANVNIGKEEARRLSLPEGPYVKLTVKDQGTGIPEEHLPKIFDPYFTTKKKGSGLGLATCYSIIKRHDGRIEVKSKVGAGSIFNIYLPASPEQAEVKKAVSKPKKCARGKILVMDDEPEVRDVAARMLERLGHQVETARDGADAVSRYKEALESGRPFDAVILDLTVPGGMGGKNALKKLRQADPQVRAIVSSGYSEDPVLAGYRGYGFRGVVTKPYELEKLKSEISRVLTEKKSQVDGKRKTNPQKPLI